MIEYKAKWNGIEILIADRFFASSKMCNICGCVNDNLTLADREWECCCGEKHNRDLNAAINLSRYRQFGGNRQKANAHGEAARPAKRSACRHDETGAPRGSGNLSDIIA